MTEKDSTPWINLNNNASTGAPEAATIMAPGWAHWSIGDLAPDPKDATKEVATWNDEVFGTFVLPGVGGGVAPVFAGGSNIAISATSKNQDGAAELIEPAEIAVSILAELIAVRRGGGDASGKDKR